MENVDTLTTALDLGWRHLSFPPADAPYAPPSSPHTTLDLGEDASSEEDEAAEHVKNELSWSDVEHVRDMLITGRQQEVYLRKLLSEVELSRCSLDELLVRLKKRLLQIHDTVRFRTAIPTIQVYPQFIDLSEIWTGFQNEMVLLDNINNILWNLHSYTEGVRGAG
ncbi:unnamed protein product, partial [Timema podura]|nr:unnamed protein product [Timema podura]